MYDNYRFIHFLFPLTRIISLSTSSVSSGDYSSGTNGLLDAQSSSRICSSAGFCPVVFTTLTVFSSFNLVIQVDYTTKTSYFPLPIGDKPQTKPRHKPGKGKGGICGKQNERYTLFAAPAHSKNKAGVNPISFVPGSLTIKNKHFKKKKSTEMNCTLLQ